MNREMSSADAHSYCKRVQMVFQDPFRSFNPRRRVGGTLAEGLMNFGVIASEVHARMLKMRLATNLRYRVRL
jgi:peptide/nickel transport system ATP-binding protein